MESRSCRTKVVRSLALVCMVGLASVALFSQAASAPNPYKWDESWKPQLPDGREWGSSAGVGVDRQGNIYVAERCGGNPLGCDGKTFGPIVKIAPSGKVVATFGGGLFVQPHGLYVDRDDNIWVTDCTCTGGAGGARGNAAATPAPPATKGHQVFKFSKDGKLLMTLGKAGDGREPDFFFQPNDVLVAPNGDVFISEGHASASGSTARVLKFSKDGKFIKTWGKLGTAAGDFDQPHALAMDSKGRLFVGDRNNNRIQIFDQDGKFIEEWKQFSRPSGLYIDKNDVLYAADSESESVSRNHDGWKRGIRVGSAKDGSVKYFIPDPVEKATGTSAAEGVAADAQGNIYGAEVGPRALKRYVKKPSSD